MVHRKRSSFNTCPCIPYRIGIWQSWFLLRGENRRTWSKTSRSKERPNNKLYFVTTPNHAGSGNGTRTRLVGGECSHHCATTAPLDSIHTNSSMEQEPLWL